MGGARVEPFRAPATHLPDRPLLRRARVAYILANRGYGGTEVHLRQLVLGLDREKFDPVVLLVANKPMGVLAEELRDAGIAVETLPTVTRRVDLRTFVDLVRVIRAQRAGIVHVHMPGPAGGLSVFLAARLAGAPLIVSTEHSHAYHLRSASGPRGAWLRTIARLRLRLSNRLIAVSAAQQASFQSVLGVRPERTTVIWNGIDPDRYSSGHDGAAIRREFDVPTSAPLAGMVTSHVEHERAEDFVRAAARVANVEPAAHFWVVGDQHPTVVKDHATMMRSMLENLTEELGLKDRVHFLGYRTDMPRVMSALDVFVLPARYKSFGLVLLEAMATEVPVVATAAGGVPEIVRHGESGFVVPPLDPRALATAMLSVLTNKEEALRMGRQGRRRVEQAFTTASMVDRTTELYRLLLARPHAQAMSDAANER
jgi:glycosyltransferase involved in cell wall biosynthesis